MSALDLLLAFLPALPWAVWMAVAFVATLK
jgi:hypothetical protein